MVLGLCLLAVAQLHAADTLKVIVIDGEEAANIVAEKLAATPVIEVRDEKDRKVAGAIVRFVIRKTVRNRLAAVFRNGQSEVRTLTDAAGQANSSAITPLEPGSFEIEVEVRYPGATGKATIRQTNFRTVAEAKAAGREPAKSTSSNSTAQTSTPGAGGTAAGGAAAGGAAPAASAAGASAGAAAAGGGMSKLAVVGLVAGGAAGAGAAIVLSRKEDPPPPAGVVGAVTASQDVGVQAATPFAFSVQPTGFDAATLSYRWEFGDGATSTDPAPTHVYQAPGVYTVVVTVRDARQSQRSEMSVTVHTVTGTWAGGQTILQLTQSGSTISGIGSVESGRQEPFTQCAMTGEVQVGAPARIGIAQPPCRHAIYPNFDSPFIEYRLFMSPDGQVIFGEREIASTPTFPARTQNVAYRRQ